MIEQQRQQRNAAMLAECHVDFAARLRTLMVSLDDAGFRPRIQQAWRSPEAQREAFTSGHSKLRFGYHNTTTPSGAPAAMAVDLLDDYRPLAPTTVYLLVLARAATDGVFPPRCGRSPRERSRLPSR